MTANETRAGAGVKDRYSPRMNGSTVGGSRREESRTGSIPRREEDGAAVSAVMYIYGDRVCRKESKQRQLYKEYGAAAGFDGQGVVRKKRYKIVLENIINLFESIEERRKQDVESAKHSAVMRKKFIEHRRGVLLALFMVTFLAVFAILGYNLFFGISSIYAENTVNYNGDSIIAASGVAEGDKLYSFRADAVEERITFVCPYIRSVTVERTVPNRVSFALESDQAAYCVNVYGEKLVLSEGLRVLGHYDPAVNSGLTELFLPEIKYSVDGRVITFVDERQERFVREILSCISASGLKGRIGAADLRDAYAVELHCDGIYLLKMGGEKEFANKLKMAEKTIGDPDFRKNTPAYINLGTVGEASVRYDHTLDLSKDS